MGQMKQNIYTEISAPFLKFCLSRLLAEGCFHYTSYEAKENLKLFF